MKIQFLACPAVARSPIVHCSMPDLDAELASLASGLSLTSVSSASHPIVLDDVEPDAPIAVRSERPRVGSILRGCIPVKDAHSALSFRGVTLGRAAPDGNCAQRAAGCSVGWLSQSAALDSDGPTMSKLAAQRTRSTHAAPRTLCYRLLLASYRRSRSCALGQSSSESVGGAKRRHATRMAQPSVCVR